MNSGTTPLTVLALMSFMYNTIDMAFEPQDAVIAPFWPQDLVGWAQVLTPIITVTAVIVAVFAPRIDRWWRQGKLSARIECRYPFVVFCPVRAVDGKGQVVAEANSYSIRLLVTNPSSNPLRSVVAFLERLERFNHVNGKFEAVVDVTPGVQRWSDGGGLSVGYFPANSDRYLDLALVLDPQHRLRTPDWDPSGKSGFSHSQACLDLQGGARNNSKSYLQPHGRYRLHISIVGDYSPRTIVVVEIEMNGEFKSDPAEMFKDDKLKCHVVE